MVTADFLIWLIPVSIPHPLELMFHEFPFLCALVICGMANTRGCSLASCSSSFWSLFIMWCHHASRQRQPPGKHLQCAVGSLQGWLSAWPSSDWHQSGGGTGEHHKQATQMDLSCFGGSVSDSKLSSSPGGQRLSIPLLRVLPWSCWTRRPSPSPAWLVDRSGGATSWALQCFLSEFCGWWFASCHLHGFRAGLVAHGFGPDCWTPWGTSSR